MWKVISCINTDKILPENMGKRDPIRFYSFIERMGHLCQISDTKAKIKYCSSGSPTYRSQVESGPRSHSNRLIKAFHPVA